MQHTISTIYHGDTTNNAPCSMPSLSFTMVTLQTMLHAACHHCQLPWRHHKQCSMQHAITVNYHGDTTNNAPCSMPSVPFTMATPQTMLHAACHHCHLPWRHHKQCSMQHAISAIYHGDTTNNAPCSMPSLPFH